MNQVSAVDWIEKLKSLAALAGYVHDFGKASCGFQNKLRAGIASKDSVRHEWLSAHLVERLWETLDGVVETDEVELWSWWERAWEMVLRNGVNRFPLEASATHQSVRGGSFRFGLASSAQEALLLGVITHHGLFGIPGSDKESIGDLNSQTHRDRPASESAVMAPEHVFRTLSVRWSASDRKEMVEVLREVLALMLAWRRDNGAGRNWWATMLVARAALILADHEVSSEKRSKLKPFKALVEKDLMAGKATDEAAHGQGLYANTDRKSNKLNQTLPDHLRSVGIRTEKWVRALLEPSLPGLSEPVRAALLVSDESIESFRWQAVCTQALQEKTLSNPGPTLVFNLASTGAGKTRMNAKAVAALTPAGQAVRFAAGFNLKTLTLQTRDAYSKELGMKSEELACLVGDKLALALHKHPLLVDDENVYPVSMDGADFDIEYDVEGGLLDGCPDWARSLGQKDGEENPKVQRLVVPPVLVSTMDFLVNAGNPGKQAHHGHAMLRLAHSDLVLDEVDSYDPVAVAALLRVVQTAGVFGRNVVVSSATLPAPVAEALHASFCQGVLDGSSMREEATTPSVVILNNTDTPYQKCDLLMGFREFYGSVVQGIADFLDRQEASAGGVPRLATIVDVVPPQGIVSKEVPEEVVGRVAQSIEELHLEHRWDLEMPEGHRTKRVSFGLVRMANVEPCVSLAKNLVRLGKVPSGACLKVCPYTAVDLALRRKMKEENLDLLLSRKGDWKTSLLETKSFREELESFDAEEVIFVVVATPVEEVGRDHDFDWAVIEPSSVSSIVQCAGRVNRHRKAIVKSPNIHVLRQNCRALRKELLVFSKPGFETKESGYGTSDMRQLLSNSSRSLDRAFAIDTRLAFGKDRCAMASLDSASVANALVEPLRAVCRQSERDRSWANNRYYTKYPLREKNLKQKFRLSEDQHAHTLFIEMERTVRTGSHKGRPLLERVWVRTPGVFDLSMDRNLEQEPGWWLCPFGEEILKKSQGFGDLLESARIFETPMRNPEKASSSTTYPRFHSRAGGYKSPPSRR
jgi:CRISPR-associated endonuclease/helicase Cas3